MAEVERTLRDEFGLNSYEARAYVALLRKKMKPKEVASAAAIPMPRIYDTLRGLLEKGYVHLSAESYLAESPAAALRTAMIRGKNVFEEEQRRRELALREVVLRLKPLLSRRQEFWPEPVLLKGIDSIMSKFLEILNESNDILLMVRKAMRVRGIFRDSIENVPIAKKRIRILFPSTPRLSSSDLKFLKEKKIGYRIYERAILDVMVADDRDVMLGVPDKEEEEPFSAIALWVRNPRFAKSTRTGIEDIWRVSES